MVPFVDLKTQFTALRQDILRATEDVMKNAAFILGERVADFESNFASFVEAEYAVGVASGTDALHLALRAAGVGHGDEVITVVNTFYATAAAIELAGARPVFVDCTPDTYLLDTAALEAAVSPKTRAVIPVHLYGQIAPMNDVCAFAQRHNLVVVEDACQAHGARYGGRAAGSIGQSAAFSFYPGKNLGAYGDGGAVTTNDTRTYESLMALRNYGSNKKYFHPSFGTNSRLDGLQAAILSIKLEHLEAWNASRQRAAQRYRDNLAGCSGIVLPIPAEGSTHVYHLFVIQVPGDRDRIIEELGRREVQCGIHYPIPLHLQGAYSYLGYNQGDFPVAESVASRIISLPMFPEITDEQVDTVCEAIEKVLAG